MFKVEHWGRVDYNLSLQRQLEIVANLKTNKTAQESLIFCTHPPVVTLGRSSQAKGDVVAWGGPVIQSQRGGRATYHGPSQIIVYPIIDLSRWRPSLRTRDIHHYLESLEEWLVDSLKELFISLSPPSSLGVRGLQKSACQHQGRLSVTGVWVGDKKLVSIGIAVKSWVAYHGVAINIYHDPKAFQGIYPCGFQSQRMTSIEEILQRKVYREAITQILQDHFQKKFGTI